MLYNIHHLIPPNRTFIFWLVNRFIRFPQAALSKQDCFTSSTSSKMFMTHEKFVNSSRKMFFVDINALCSCSLWNQCFLTLSYYLNFSTYRAKFPAEKKTTTTDELDFLHILFIYSSFFVVKNFIYWNFACKIWPSFNF